MQRQQFKGFRRPADNFQAVRDEFQTTPLYYDIDLSVARSLSAGTHLVLPFAANAFYIDQKANSGFATFYFQDDGRAGNTPVTVFAGFIARVPVTQLIVENAAQAGAVMRVIYGVDIDFVPGVGAGVSVLNAININDAVDPVCQYLPTPVPVAIGANQVTPILLPALNPRGIVMRSLYHAVDAGGGGSIGSYVIAAAVAPVTVATPQANAIALSILADTGTVPITSTIQFNRRIPAGWGIWNICSINVAIATSHAVIPSLEIL